MTDMQKRLQTIFEKERSIFWCDENEALSDEFDKKLCEKEKSDG